MLTRSTFELSDTVESLIELTNAIENGHVYDLPIEQRLNTIYAGCSVINCITKQSHDFFTDEEQALVIDTHSLLKSEMADMGIGS
jgi:hypothetical protein